MTAAPSWETCPLAGVRIFTPRVVKDDRGCFVKTFHEDWFAAQGIAFAMREEFVSVSRKGVIRGMHFQAPPHEHAKLVSCLRGRVLDVLLDLRRGPTYGASWSVELSQGNRRVAYVPVGFAHGFAALTGNALVHYKTTAVHSPGHDTGVRWDSFGFRWPVEAPVISPRDRALAGLADINTPF